MGAILVTLFKEDKLLMTNSKTKQADSPAMRDQMSCDYNQTVFKT